MNTTAQKWWSYPFPVEVVTPDADGGLKRYHLPHFTPERSITMPLRKSGTIITSAASAAA
ncbi:MAG: hypothetical protein Q7T55_18040 [Solirubrobacteraceae bacterium]|nr:hypothetical protein [Solirubrobacteraceae bacterium]